jgi:hypothetical protein
MSSLCTPLTLHHSRMDFSGYPFGAEVSLDNSYVATTAFVNNATNVAYYNADAAEVADANYDNHNAANVLLTTTMQLTMTTQLMTTTTPPAAQLWMTRMQLRTATQPTTRV